VQKQRIAALQTLFEKLDKAPLQRSQHRVILDEKKARATLAQVQTQAQAQAQPQTQTQVRQVKMSQVTESQSETDPEAEDSSQQPQQQSDQQQQLNELELSELYEKAGQRDSVLREAEQPGTMTYELRPYQREALTWLLAKETNNLTGKGLVLHPLWEEYQFEPQSPDRFYWNPFSGELRLAFPHAGDQTYGGILADEMVILFFFFFILFCFGAGVL